MTTMTRPTTAAIDKLIASTKAIEDPIHRVTAETLVIARLRAAVSELSEDRSLAVQAAKAAGHPYSEIAKAAGMTTGRMAAIGTGRGRYVPKGETAPAPAAPEPPRKRAPRTGRTVKSDGK